MFDARCYNPSENFIVDIRRVIGRQHVISFKFSSPFGVRKMISLLCEIESCSS